MNISKQQLDQTLEHIDSLLKDKDLEKAYLEYISFEKMIEDTKNQMDESIKANFYAAFAFFLFNISEYENFIIRLKKAQSHGYSAKEVKKIIWEGFIEPNLSELKSNYEQNIQFLLSNKYILETVDFDDLPFWLITTGVQNEYYIYDKNEEIIKEKFIINANYEKCSSIRMPENISRCLMLEKWNFNIINSCLRNKNIKGYTVVDDLGKFLSCFQGELLTKETFPDLLIFSGFVDMIEYFKACSTYLPKLIVDFMDQKAEAERTIKEIHNYRITKDGRKGDNILLSICIPSYNRGKRAYDNVLHNLQALYDEEIEVILSNNGTQNDSAVYYDKISQMNDSRLIYYSFAENQGFVNNLCKVCELANGKYVLLLSDEDLVNIDGLDRVLNILAKNPETLAVVRTKGNVQAGVPSTKLAQPGREALLTYMLSSNYMSGVIFNNKLLQQYNALQYIKENLSNSACFYYPHMVWEVLLCQYGYALGTDIVLINEGAAEKSNEDNQKVGLKVSLDIPHYSSVEGRIEQHGGFFDIFKNLEICQKDFSLFREMYIVLCNKTLYLVYLSINVFYKKTDIPVLELLSKAHETCIEFLNKLYTKRKGRYKKYYIEDLEKIKRIYNYYSDRL